MANVTSVKFLCNCVYGHALSCTELAFRHATETHLEFGVANKDEKQPIYRAWPWISNCWEWDPNCGLSGLESSALTTRPRRLGANLRHDVTRIVPQPISACRLWPQKKKDSHFKTRSLSGTSNKTSLGLLVKIWMVSVHTIFFGKSLS